MEERVSRKRFIRLGAALSVTATGAVMVAACGESGGSGGSGNDGSGGGASSSASGNASSSASSSASGSAASSAASSSSSNAQAPGGQAIAGASDVAAGSAVKFQDGGSPAVLVHLDSGDFVAYSAVCTHQGCTVAYQNGQLACPCHGSVFDPANSGSIISPPATQPLPEIPVEVRGGQVFRA